MADMVRARWWDSTAASMSREFGKNDRECVFFATTLHRKSSGKIIFLFASVTWERLKGMLSQAILQRADSKRLQMDLA